jgi:signal transduction histidine kinase
MKRFFSNFYVKLSSLFLILLITMGAVQVFITVKITEKRQAEADQWVNRRLAEAMVTEIEPYVNDDSIDENIGSIIHYMMVLNPAIEIYLLDRGGNILAFFSEPGKQILQNSVDITPIEKFLLGTENIPIFGDDPCNPGIRKHFSAARIDLGQEESGYLYIVLRSSVYDQTVRTLKEKYFASALMRGLLLSLIFVGIIGLILFAFLTRRIQNVSRSVKEFERGRYDQRISVTSQDEIGDLANAFNHMADTITANMENLKQTDNLRRELVANVSHDLRSPLASIQGYIETILMKREILPPEELQSYLETILADATQLNRLVEELFELSKLDAKQIDPYLETFSLTELLQDVSMKYKSRAERLNVRLSAKLPKQLYFVNADIGMIERVLSNLVENALKFTPAQGTVRLSIHRDDGQLKVRISDTGKGIPPEDIPHIFDRFYRGDGSRSNAPRSSGLGLAISQKIMELHHSSIRVNSELEKGSTFEFELPCVDQCT